MILTPKIEKAITRSAELHRHQERKGNGAPYIVHPYSVAFLLAHYTEDEDIICAGLLHDILEDVPSYGAQRMQEEFGERVYRIVREVTEDRDPTMGWRLLPRQRQWKERKVRYIENLKNDSEEALLIACADKIQNLRSLVDTYALRGDGLWSSFRSGKEEMYWFYTTVFEVIAERFHHPLVHEFKKSLEEAKKQVFLGGRSGTIDRSI
jgi:(p)ppGpp synthase/HD superfamily hydrolase